MGSLIPPLKSGYCKLAFNVLNSRFMLTIFTGLIVFEDIF